MARLERGEDAKIDKINDCVDVVKNEALNGTYEQNECMKELLKLFKPLILKICKKWSDYFNDSDHKLISFDELVTDAEYWMLHYTKYKYTCGGSATFNTFIKTHLDQRIRYIYEQNLNHYKKLIFPDPDKRADHENDSFDNVLYNYNSDSDENSYSIDDDDTDENRIELAHKIINIINTNGVFNEREREIFISIVYNGVTHDSMALSLNISRTRVTQILRKTKAKLYKIMNDSQDVWDLVIKADVDFEEI